MSAASSGAEALRYSPIMVLAKPAMAEQIARAVEMSVAAVGVEVAQ